MIATVKIIAIPSISIVIIPNSGINGNLQIKAVSIVITKQRFYDLDISENEFKVISALRAQTTRDLLLALIENEGLSFQTLRHNLIIFVLNCNLDAL